VFGILGIVFMVGWFFTSFVFGFPSVLDVFGFGGLKIPGGIVILSLLFCAFGFEKINS
jgi:hypothetical protein